MDETQHYEYHRARDLNDGLWQTLLAELDSDDETKLASQEYTNRAWEDRGKLLGRSNKQGYEVIAAYDGHRYRGMVAGRPVDGFVAVLGRLPAAAGHGLGLELLNRFAALATASGAMSLRTKLDPRAVGLELRKRLAEGYGFKPCQPGSDDLCKPLAGSVNDGETSTSPAS